MTQAALRSPPAKLGELLLEEGVVEPVKLRRALQMQQQLGGHLGTALLELGAVSERRLLRTLGRQRSTPTVDANDLAQVSPDLLKLVPAKLAARHRVVPFRRQGRTLHLASIEPGAVLVEDEIALLTSCMARTYVGLEVRVLEALDRYYGVERGNRFVHLAERLHGLEAAPEAEPKEPSGQLALDESLLRDPRPSTQGPLRGPSTPPHAEPVRGEPERGGSPLDGLLDPTPSDHQSISVAKVRQLLDQTAQEASTAPPADFAELGMLPDAEPLPVVGLREELTAIQQIVPASGVRPTGRPQPAARDPQSGAEPTAAECLATASKALQHPEIRDDIADAVLGFCETHFRRTLLLVHRRERVLGWRGRGRGVDLEALRGFSSPVEEPSVFSALRLGTSAWIGPLASQPGNRRLMAVLMGIAPRECLVLPIRLRGRVVAFLYVDNRAGDLGSSPVDEAGKLARMVGIAFELYLLRNKLRQLAE